MVPLIWCDDDINSLSYAYYACRPHNIMLQCNQHHSQDAATKQDRSYFIWVVRRCGREIEL